MLSLSDIKTGKAIALNGEPYLVISHQHSKTGRAGAVLRTKIRNLKTGSVVEKTFQGSDKVTEAEIAKTKATYLYHQDADFYFMDISSYEQFSLPRNVLGDLTKFLIENTEATILNFNGQPINIELPIKMEFRVVEAPPTIRGNTADGGSKLVKLETGINVSTPLFVKSGDVIRINTETGGYVERVNK